MKPNGSDHRWWRSFWAGLVEERLADLVAPCRRVGSAGRITSETGRAAAGRAMTGSLLREPSGADGAGEVRTRSAGVATVHLLWTGGWDSSFRLLSLATRDVGAIQPYYIVDRERRTWQHELTTMAAIMRACRHDPSRYHGRILDPVIVEKDDIAADEEITRQFEQIRARAYLGTQYEWLARFAKQRGIRPELAVQRDGRIHALLHRQVELVSGPATAVYRLRPDVDGDLSLFRHFSYPILGVSKLEMDAEARAGGFLDVLELSWFCFQPLPGPRPCGVCNPCRYAIEEGLARRVGWPGLLRYYVLRRPLDLLPARLKAIMRQMRGRVRQTA